MTPAKAPLPFLGTWKLTKCESSHPNLPHPVAGTTTFTQEQDSIRYENEGMWSDGTKTNTHAVLTPGGSWCPVVGSLLADSLSIEIIPNGLAARMRKGGVEVGTTRATVAADGRTMNSEWEIARPGGAAITWKTTTVRV
ncbi:MAG TPA: hypothetical protein VME17_13435 [Bryobacteraceae bacterium]|nr:hypothetical protein [Bryobacteraceae bacterium]